MVQGVAAEEGGEEEGEDENDNKKSEDENDEIDGEIKDSESKEKAKKENIVEVEVEKAQPKSEQGEIGKPPKPPGPAKCLEKKEEPEIRIAVEENRPPTPPREPRYNVVELLQKGCTLRYWLIMILLIVYNYQPSKDVI